MGIAVQGDATGEKWRVTLRYRLASLTETIGHAPCKDRHGDRVGEGAR
jgi:hypothetical protein